jgi:hypothetical protein
MPGNATVDHAIVDALHILLEGTRAVHIVGVLSDGPRERLAGSLAGGLSTAERLEPSPTRHEAVVVLDAQHLGEAKVVVSAGGTLIVAAINPCYGSFLVDALEGGRALCRGSADLRRVCDRLETDGWAVEDATPVTVPLALMPFDPGRIPKTVLAYLYARHPEIEIYCFLVRARRAGARPPRPRPVARAPSGDFSTMPWKTEAEWGEEMRRHPDDVADAARRLEETARRLESLRLDLVRSDEELMRIKSSLTWRAVVKYRTLRERLLPPQSGGGRLYERVRSTIRRQAVGGD